MSLEQCFDAYQACAPDDQTRISHLLLTLTQGMIIDLTAFPHEHAGGVQALKTRTDLDYYTYCVAGCVGEFWTEMHMAHRAALANWHLEAMQARAIRFGKGLQLTNILRDLPRDLRLGRCYVPLEDLEAHGLQPETLLDPAAIVKVRPVLHSLIHLTLDHYRHGWDYTLAIPRREVQMRLACAWPLCIGLRTLNLVAKADNLLDPTNTVKIPRRTVYAIILSSSLLIPFNRGLHRYAHYLGRPLFRSDAPTQP
jgi:farnesyl-diphosphate farnesyltransferase